MKRAEKESKKTRFHPPLTVFLLYQRALCQVSSFSFLRTESVFSFFGADSLSRSVHCAPDENDRPSEQTKKILI